MATFRLLVAFQPAVPMGMRHLMSYGMGGSCHLFVLRRKEETQ